MGDEAAKGCPASAAQGFRRRAGGGRAGAEPSIPSRSALRGKRRRFATAGAVLSLRSGSVPAGGTAGGKAGPCPTGRPGRATRHRRGPPRLSPVPDRVARKWPKTTAGLDLHACDPDLRRWLAIRAPDSWPTREAAVRFRRLGWRPARRPGPAGSTGFAARRRLRPGCDENGTLQRGLVVRPGLTPAAMCEAYCRGAIGLCFGERSAPHLLSLHHGYLLGQADVSIHCPVTLGKKPPGGAVAVVLDRSAPRRICAEAVAAGADP